MPKVERRRVRKTVVSGAVSYDVEIGIFRNWVTTQGMTDCTEWIFDSRAPYRVKPDPGDLFPQLVNQIISEENGASKP